MQPDDCTLDRHVGARRGTKVAELREEVASGKQGVPRPIEKLQVCVRTHRIAEQKDFLLVKSRDLEPV